MGEEYVDFGEWVSDTNLSFWLAEVIVGVEKWNKP